MDRVGSVALELLGENGNRECGRAIEAGIIIAWAVYSEI